MADIIDFEARRNKQRLARMSENVTAEEVDFENTVDQIIMAMIHSPINSLGELLTAGCVALIDLQELNGRDRIEAIKTLAQKIGLFEDMAKDK